MLSELEFDCTVALDGVHEEIMACTLSILEKRSTILSNDMHARDISVADTSVENMQQQHPYYIGMARLDKYDEMWKSHISSDPDNASCFAITHLHEDYSELKKSCRERELSTIPAELQLMHHF